MRFYPIAYHSYEDKRGTGIIIFAIEKTNNPQRPYEKVALKFRYTHWFYVSLENHSYEEVRNALIGLSGVSLDAPSVRENINTIVQERRSTINPHTPVKVVRVHADQYISKQEAMRILNDLYVRIYESDDMLTPILKMMAEKDVKKYQWMDVGCEIAANLSTKWEREYVADVSTLCGCKEDIPPPPFSILSFDIETDSTNVNEMPDAKSSLGNAIRVLAFTFVDPIENRYEEYALVYGYNIEDTFRQFRPQEIGPRGIVTILTFMDELEMIRKFFNFINELDPSVITGHNILSFDNDYIFYRYKLLAMQKMCKGKGAGQSVKLPNISRLREHSCSVQPVKWHNSQVAMEGMYFSSPGRIWVDTLIVAARGLLGNMENKKLDTLAKVHLGMAKNDVSYKDMFLAFRLTRDWKRACNTIASDSIGRSIRNLYIQMVSKHNKDIPPLVEKPIINHLNSIVGIINSMSQRGTKMKMYAQRDVLKLNMKEEYEKIRNKCIDIISSWNIPLEENLPVEECLRVMWWLVVMYCLQDTRIPYQILDQQNIIQVLCEQASVFGADINDILMRGQVYTVTCSQYSYNYKMGMMVDFGNPGGPTGMYEYEGGYVGKGEPGLKITDNDTVIITLDFASLYPTIIIAYNICYTTWVAPNMRMSQAMISASQNTGIINKDYIWLKYETHILRRKVRFQQELDSIKDDVQQKERVEILREYIHELNTILEAPYEKKGQLMCHVYGVPNPHSNSINEIWFLRASVQEGTLPNMLWEQYKARKAIKRSMDRAKKEGNMSMYVTFNAQQLAVKVSMNASYGALGTATNRLACFPGAELITYIGRTGILQCNDHITKKGLDDVVYNDTDSGFIRVPRITERFGRDIKKIKEYGQSLATELGNLFPRPMGMEMENIFVAFLLKKSKHYAGIKCDGESLDIDHYTWEYINMFGLLYVKGMTPVRSDKFKYNKDIFNKVLYNILVRSGPEKAIALLEFSLQQIWNQRGEVKNPQMIERMFSYNMGITPTALEGGNGAMAKWISIYEKKYKQKPSPGEKFKLIVTNVSSGPDAGKHTKAATKMVTLDWFIEEKRTLDVQHYIETLGNDGNVVDIMTIAYPDCIQKNCIKQWYLPKLRRDNHLHDE